MDNEKVLFLKAVLETLCEGNDFKENKETVQDFAVELTIIIVTEIFL